MLVLSRREEQEIRIGPDIRIRVLRVSGSTVKLGIEAPRQTSILRAELGEDGTGWPLPVGSSDGLPAGAPACGR